jgi:hypothetical protein
MTRLLPPALRPLLVLPLLLTAPLAPAAAQWVKVGSASGSTSYLDKASIRRAQAGQGDGVRAVSLVSFDAIQSTPDGTRYRSMKAQHLYACDSRSTTLLSQSYYPEPMGKGPVGQSFKYEKFAPEPVAAGSAAEGALRIICRDKR